MPQERVTHDEAIRLLSWLAKGSRLDDIERNIHSRGNAVVRGQSTDLFVGGEKCFTLGIHIDNAPDDWTDFEIGIGQLSDQLIVTAETITSKNEELPLYKIEGSPNPHTDEISVMYNDFSRGKISPIFPARIDKPFFIN